MKSLVKKDGMHYFHWRGAMKELTLDNDLEDTVVFLCHEVVRRDKLFQEVLDQIRELDGCSCENVKRRRRSNEKTYK